MTPKLSDFEKAKSRDVPLHCNGDLLMFRVLQKLSHGREGSRKPERPMWAIVRDYCGTGSTTATNICIHYGIDPDKMART